jgi:tetratricopeptide (TPR) repeat protein
MLADAQMIADAQSAYNEAIRLDPRFAPPYRRLAELAAASGHPDLAVVYWKGYVAHASNPPHAWCRLAYAELMSGLEVPALQDAERELQQAPECGTAHLIAGVLYARKSDAKQALDHLEPAAKAYPDNPRVQILYGRVLALSGSFDRAEQVLRAILAKDKAYAEPFYLLGYVYARRPSTPENRRQAEEAFRSALALAPDNPQASYELGSLTFKQRRAREALPLAEKALAGRKHYPAALALRAQCEDALGRTQDAVRTRALFYREREMASREKALLRQYVLDPNRIETSLALVQLEMDLDKTDSALPFLQDVAQRAPDDPRLAPLLKRADRLRGPQNGGGPGAVPSAGTTRKDDPLSASLGEDVAPR